MPASASDSHTPLPLAVGPTSRHRGEEQAKLTVAEMRRRAERLATHGVTRHPETETVMTLQPVVSDRAIPISSPYWGPRKLTSGCVSITGHHKTRVAVSENAGVKALVACALQEQVRQFYEHYGFELSPMHPMTLRQCLSAVKVRLTCRQEDKLTHPIDCVIEGESSHEFERFDIRHLE
jgi:hypothetical protein